MRTLGISAVAPANDNAVTEYLDSEEAQSASPSTVLQIVRLAKCGPVNAEALARLQHVLDFGLGQ